jgi:hypothetical protein
LAASFILSRASLIPRQLAALSSSSRECSDLIGACLFSDSWHRFVLRHLSPTRNIFAVDRAAGIRVVLPPREIEKPCTVETSFLLDQSPVAAFAERPKQNIQKGRRT